jgi:hypothetical protein
MPFNESFVRAAGLRGRLRVSAPRRERDLPFEIYRLRFVIAGKIPCRSQGFFPLANGKTAMGNGKSIPFPIS